MLDSDEARFLADVASGRRLGGTGLANPVKGFYGVGTIRLNASPTPSC